MSLTSPRWASSATMRTRARRAASGRRTTSAGRASRAPTRPDDGVHVPAAVGDQLVLVGRRCARRTISPGTWDGEEAPPAADLRRRHRLPAGRSTGSSRRVRRREQHPAEDAHPRRRPVARVGHDLRQPAAAAQQRPADAEQPVLEPHGEVRPRRLRRGCGRHAAHRARDRRVSAISTIRTPATDERARRPPTGCRRPDGPSIRTAPALTGLASPCPSRRDRADASISSTNRA